MSLSIAILAAGAGNMYCGSCLRDDALAAALVRAGQRVTLVPMYTPMRIEEGGDGNVGGRDRGARGEVFYGGINVYLQHLSRIFRHTPRAVDWLLNRPALLKLAGRLATETSPAELGPLTIAILRGEDGPTAKELRRLVDFLKSDVKADIVSLPNLMFIGLARTLRQELGATVVCELTGEDLFLGQLVEPYRSQAQAIMRERAGDVSAFVATSRYYADEMSRYLAIDRARVAVVHPGVPGEYVVDKVPTETRRCEGSRPPTVGYVARICPEKGFGQAVEAMKLLRGLPGLSDATLMAGGYLGGSDRRWFEKIMANAQGVTYVGELDRRAKLELLDSIDVLSVPSVYAEAKGIYVLEAMARGVPVVQPAHGSFPELIELTGGGVLTPPGNLSALAAALAELLRDPARRGELGRAGHDAVRSSFTNDHMARKMLEVYRQLS